MFDDRSSKIIDRAHFTSARAWNQAQLSSRRNGEFQLLEMPCAALRYLHEYPQWHAPADEFNWSWCSFLDDDD
jgi:hypothetical protein